MTPGRLANVSGAVLTGGASSRMGRDKAGIEIGGVPAAQRAAHLLSELFEEVVIVGGAPPDSAPGRRVPDGDGPQCALRGVVAALETCESERVLVLATDLPLVSADLLLALVAWPEADAVVPCDAAGLHPLCALYRRDAVLPLARRHLRDGPLALHALLDALDTRLLEGTDLAAVDPDASALSNLNTPDDLARIEAWLTREKSRG